MAGPAETFMFKFLTLDGRMFSIPSRDGDSVEVMLETLKEQIGEDPNNYIITSTDSSQPAYRISLAWCLMDHVKLAGLLAKNRVCDRRLVVADLSGSRMLEVGYHKDDTIGEVKLRLWARHEVPWWLFDLTTAVTGALRENDEDNLVDTLDGVEGGAGQQVCGFMKGEMVEG